MHFMNHHIEVALIECGRPEQGFIERSANLPQNFQVTKAFAFHESAKAPLHKRFPELEWATDCNAILQDETIGFVLFSAPTSGHRALIGAALKANKQVQIV
jgi:predicted dehydrogenase